MAGLLLFWGSGRAAGGALWVPRVGTTSSLRLAACDALRVQRISRIDDKEVAAACEQFRLSNEKNERILRPLIETVLAACQEALLDLEHAHQLVADRTDLNLLGRSRRSARWLVTGRCIGFGHAALDLVRLGYAGEVVPIIRSMHETARLLSVLNLGGEDDLIARWIAGRNVSRREIMAASDRQEQAIRARMLRDGVRPASPTKSQVERHHGRWSEYAHPRRGPMTDQVSESAASWQRGRIRTGVRTPYSQSTLATRSPKSSRWADTRSRSTLTAGGLNTHRRRSARWASCWSA